MKTKASLFVLSILSLCILNYTNRNIYYVRPANAERLTIGGWPYPAIILDRVPLEYPEIDTIDWYSVPTMDEFWGLTDLKDGSSKERNILKRNNLINIFIVMLLSFLVSMIGERTVRCYRSHNGRPKLPN